MRSQIVFSFLELVKLLVISSRPKQWIKNLIIFAPLLFSSNLKNPPLLLKSTIAFSLFCLLTSSIYIINDIQDRKNDALHRFKSKRPIASGQLKPNIALVFALIIFLVSIVFSWGQGISFFLVMSTYFILQLAYTKLLKNVVIVDVMVIATGFVLRVIAGSEILNVEMSSWLLICTFLLALFLSLSKRRSELTSVPGNSHLQRKVLTKYSPYLLDQMISVVTSSTFIAYILYTISDETVKRIGTKNLIFTIPFVMFGIFRYLYLIHKKEEGERPEITMLTDLPLIFIIFLWVCSLYIIIY